MPKVSTKVSSISSASPTTGKSSNKSNRSVMNAASGTLQRRQHNNNKKNNDDNDDEIAEDVSASTIQQQKKLRQQLKQQKVESNTSSNQHEPLEQVITNDMNRSMYATTKKISLQTKNVNFTKNYDNTTKIDDIDIDLNNDSNVNTLLDSKTSKRILQLSKEQQYEIEMEEQQLEIKNSTIRRQQKKVQEQIQRKMNKNNNNNMSDDEDEEDDEDDKSEMDNDVDDDDIAYVTEDKDGGYVTLSNDVLGLGPEDEALVASMMKNSTKNNNTSDSNNNNTTKQSVTLADMILNKIEQHKYNIENSSNDNNNEMQIEGEENDNDNNNNNREAGLPPKIVEVYTGIGKILSRYTAGKLPKAFKVIPSLNNWISILYLTQPHNWTCQAMYAATRIFASNLNPKMAIYFYKNILLVACLEDIQTNKKLNYHYYISLKKAIYKPIAFFRGIVIPLCVNPNCTLREGAIIASVLQRVSIPVHHAAVAIHKLAQINTTTTGTTGNGGTAVSIPQYNGVSSIFLKTLLNKKYSLPTPVITSLIQHFLSFLNISTSITTTNDSNSNITTVLPVLWHQSLLIFVQRYKNEIIQQQLTDESVQRDLFRKLLKQQYHHLITPEIRRELFGTASTISSTGGNGNVEPMSY